MADWITISSGTLTAAINPHGAELSSLRDADGRELMTDADPAYWTGRAPILFPVIGLTNKGVIRLDGTEYPMPKHGFARHSDFAVCVQEDNRLVFRLIDSAATRVHYPFAFVLEIEFRIEGATLHVEARVSNPGTQSLPASFGYHPAFAWPLPYGEARSDHRIVFAADEPGRLREISPDGLIAAEMRASPLDGRTLHLADALFENDALVWSPVESHAVSYGAASGPQLDIAFPDAQMLGIWTKPGAHYICIEPWNGIADPEGYAGDYRDKPGVEEIAPSATHAYRLTVTLSN